MPRLSGSKDYISLAQGLVTEASPLAFPENATSDELNFVLNKDGLIRSRRKGLEAVRTVQNVAEIASIDNVYYWQAPDLILIILNTASPSTELRIHRNNASLEFLGSYVLNNAQSIVEIAENTNIIYLTTSEGQKPVLLEYEQENSRVQIYEVDIFVRDFELVDDGLAISERPTTLDDNHTYNLYNAGWYKERRYQYAAGQPLQDPIQSFFTDANSNPPENDYPSNADIVALGMGPNENGVVTFRDDVVRGTDVGNSEAPRGHYIYNINSYDRDQRLADKTIDGSVSSTLTNVGTVNI